MRMLVVMYCCRFMLCVVRRIVGRWWYFLVGWCV